MYVPLQIYSQPLVLSQIVCLSRQYGGGERYERYQHHTVIAGNTISLAFNKAVAGSGTRLTLLYPEYRLRLSPVLLSGDIGPGVERASCKVAKFGVDTRGTLTGTLGDAADGLVLCEIVPYDAAGNQAASSPESYPRHFIWLDRYNQARDFPFAVLQNGVFEWVHGVSSYQFALVPKTAIVATNAPPMGPRTPTFFSHVPVPAALTRRNVAPYESGKMTPRRPAITARGITVFEGKQGYFWDDAFGGLDYRNPASELPLIDGLRGQATSAHTLFMWGGIKNKIYGASPHSIWVMNSEGRKRTLVGTRHKREGYWEDRRTLGADPLAETVGIWDESIPVKEREPSECWAFDFVKTTLALAMEREPLGDPPEHPHVGVGPLMLASDRHGYVLNIQFDGSDPERVKGWDADWQQPHVHRLCPVDDPWGLRTDNVLDPETGEEVFYVCERARHRVLKKSVRTGATLAIEWGDERAERELGNRINNAGSGAMPRTWIGPGQATCRTYNLVAPEGLAIDYINRWIYVGSYALGEVRRKKLGAPSDQWQLVCRPDIDLKSRYIMLSSCSDGKTGPVGALLTSTWSNVPQGGRPDGWYPRPGGVPEADSKTIPSHVYWNWSDTVYDYLQGPGGKTASQSYAEAAELNGGRILCSSASHGISEFILRLPQDGPVPDYTVIQQGAAEFVVHHALLHGPGGNGHIDRAIAPLPWGRSEALDAYMQSSGQIAPPVVSLLDDASFEQAALPANGIQYSPTDSAWTFAGAGVTSSGSAFGGTAYVHKQFAFIQNNKRFSQTKYLKGGKYELSFRVARRVYATPANAARPIGVLLDGQQIHRVVPASKNWELVTLTFTVASGDHEIGFVGLDYVAGQDITSFIDTVMLKVIELSGPTPEEEEAMRQEYEQALAELRAMLEEADASLAQATERVTVETQRADRAEAKLVAVGNAATAVETALAGLREALATPEE
jgi:hypothetical protein